MLKHEGVQSPIESVYIEEELKEPRKEFQTLFNLMPDPVVIVDGKGNFLAVNDKLEEKTGFKREELLGKNFMRTKIVTARSKAILTKNLAKRMTRMPIAPYEIEVLTKDGRRLPFEVNAAKIKYESKAADLVVLRDISERKKMGKKVEERTTELRRNEEKLKTIFTSSPNAITVSDLNGNLTNCNQATLDMGGFSSKEELIGKSGFEFIAEKDRQRAMEELKKILEQGSMKNIEYTLLTKDGREYPAEVSASVIKDSSGKPAGFVAVTKNIAEHKKIEEALRRSEEKYRSLVELAPDSIVTLDMKGVITSCNRAMIDLTGYSKDKLVGKHFFEIGSLQGRDMPKYQKLLHFLMRGKTPEPFEVVWYRKDGTSLICEVRFRLIKEDGKAIGIQAIIRDITESELMADKLRKQNILLKKMDEVKSRFISIATHELRTPLASIKGYIRVLRSGEVGDVPETIDEMLEVVERNADRLVKITDDLLDQQRIESGRLDISPETIRLQDIIEEVAHEVKSTISGKGQVFYVKVPTDLPPVKADRIRISQAIINLLNNASKFTPENGGITLKAREAGDMVEVQVSDTGIGIAKEDLAKLFKPFPDIQKPNFYKGTGLGLSICKGIIDLHRGKIWAESEGKGKGATFTFTIPKQKGGE